MRKEQYAFLSAKIIRSATALQLQMKSLASLVKSHCSLTIPCPLTIPPLVIETPATS
ncbi:MAG TPA: hypothetical protein PK074_13585 [Spirochaetales bacterium]|nr:hypothetical protein [Spirochaetales bacterium]HRV27152.1 hypothetical protein [Spirochaetia bacterium]